MGECGCSSVDPSCILKAGRKYIVVFLYLPCKYCDGGFAISIAKMGKKELREWGYDRYDIIDPDDERGHTIGMLEGQGLRKAAKKYLTDPGEFDDNIFSILMEAHMDLRKHGR